MDAAACSDMSVARSVSVDLSTSMAVDFDDRSREIFQNVATPEIDDTLGASYRFLNPSHIKH